MVGIRKIHLGLLAVTIGFTPMSTAVAATATATTSTNAAATPPNGQGLEISPPVLELSADPGQTVVANIRIRNITSGPLVVTGQADDFGAKGEDGTPEILLDETEATRFSLKYWVPSVPNLSLIPQEAKNASVQIRVPKNAEPGGHYGVIRFTGSSPQVQGSGVGLSASIGTLVLLRVSGALTEKLSISDFYATHSGVRHSFFENGPISLTERIRNDGSVHMKPVGYVDVYNTLGKKISHQPVSNPARNILPDSVRKFDQTLAQKRLFGRYTAKFNVTYGASKTLQSKTISFWVIPYKLILIALLLIVIIFYALRFTLRRYKKRIIAQARRQK